MGRPGGNFHKDSYILRVNLYPLRYNNNNNAPAAAWMQFFVPAPTDEVEYLPTYIPAPGGLYCSRRILETLTV